MKCRYSSSGCNYPEGECLGLCLPSKKPALTAHGFVQLEQDLGFPRFFWPAVTSILLVVILGVWGLVQVHDDLEYMLAMEEHRVASVEQAGKELAHRKALQEACGGPEATVMDLAHGGYACLDTNGRRTKTIPGRKS